MKLTLSSHDVLLTYVTLLLVFDFGIGLACSLGYSPFAHFEFYYFIIPSVSYLRLHSQKSNALVSIVILPNLLPSFLIITSIFSSPILVSYTKNPPKSGVYTSSLFTLIRPTV